MGTEADVDIRNKVIDYGIALIGFGEGITPQATLDAALEDIVDDFRVLRERLEVRDAKE